MQKTSYPLPTFQRHELRLAGAAFFVLEDHLVTVVGNDGMLAHGGATDITREILNDVFARANRLGVSVPVFMPDTAWQGMIELGTGS